MKQHLVTIFFACVSYYLGAILASGWFDIEINFCIAFATGMSVLTIIAVFLGLRKEM